MTTVASFRAVSARLASFCEAKKTNATMPPIGFMACGSAYSSNTKPSMCRTAM